MSSINKFADTTEEKTYIVERYEELRIIVDENPIELVVFLDLNNIVN